MKSLIAVTLTVTTFAAAILPASPAFANDAELIRRSFRRHATPAPELTGVERVVTADQLDLEAPLDDKDLETIETAIRSRYGGTPMIEKNLTELMKRATSRGPRSIVVLYVGIDVGIIFGVAPQVGLAFGRMRGFDGKIGVAPVTGVRLSVLDIGVDVHVGVGSYSYSERSDAVSGGGHMLGGAYFAGAAVGASQTVDAVQFFVEAKAGMKVQVGGFTQTFTLHLR